MNDANAPAPVEVHAWLLTEEFLLRRREMLQRICDVLQHRSLWQAPGSEPLTAWPDKAKGIGFADFVQWMSHVERSPATNLDAAAKAPRPMGAAQTFMGAAELSRARADAFDQLRVALAVVSICAYSSLLSTVRLHTALNVHDGVTPLTGRDGRPVLHVMAGLPVPVLRRDSDTSHHHRRDVIHFAALFGHVVINEILTGATGYQRSYEYLRERGIAREEWPRWLGRQPLLGLSTISPLHEEVRRAYRDLYQQRSRARLPGGR